MVSDELFLLSGSHSSKRVIFTLELTGEFTQCRCYELFDFLSLLSGNGSTKRICSQVSSDTNSCRVDHLVFIRRESRTFEVVVVHVGNVLVTGLVAVIRLNDLVEERSEGVVRIVGSSIDTDSGISPLGTGEDALLEGETEFISSVLALFPDLRSKALG
jgi:hypothetical protein